MPAKVFILALISAFSLNSYGVTRINGAGATFPHSIYAKWFSEYNKLNENVEFNYQAIGSSGGIRQLLKQTVDFGASDAPMKMKSIKKAPWPVLHVPTVLGAVTISYNVPGVNQSLRMDGGIVADIFLGKIRKWNHPRIAVLNKGVKLPATDILVVRRSDGSGTTAIFSDYLAQESTEWKNKVGQGKSLRWPTGIGAKGNAGIAAQVKNNPGAVGYVDLAYASKNKFTTAALKNPAGRYIVPSIAGISASGTKRYIKGGVSIVNSPNKHAYPISAFTYILLPVKKGPDAKLSEVRKFLTWALRDGQKYPATLHYAPLPKKLAESVLRHIDASFN